MMLTTLALSLSLNAYAGDAAGNTGLDALTTRPDAVEVGMDGKLQIGEDLPVATRMQDATNDYGHEGGEDGGDDGGDGGEGHDHDHGDEEGDTGESDKKGCATAAAPASGLAALAVMGLALVARRRT